MRIVGGEFKGRTIKVPKIKNLRPSTGRIREAIFSALGDDVIEANVADLFCGSGALGLEALSRGANQGLFVDADPVSITTVRDNIKLLGLETNTRILKMNALDLRASQIKDVKIIFADPPYHKGFCQRLISLLSLQKFQWYGILVLEHESDWSYNSDEFRVAKRANFGDSAVTFLISSNLSQPDSQENFAKGD